MCKFQLVVEMSRAVKHVSHVFYLLLSTSCVVMFFRLNWSNVLHEDIFPEISITICSHYLSHMCLLLLWYKPNQCFHSSQACDQQKDLGLDGTLLQWEHSAAWKVKISIQGRGSPGSPALEVLRSWCEPDRQDRLHWTSTLLLHDSLRRHAGEHWSCGGVDPSWKHELCPEVTIDQVILVFPKPKSESKVQFQRTWTWSDSILLISIFQIVCLWQWACLWWWHCCHSWYQLVRDESWHYQISSRLPSDESVDPSVFRHSWHQVSREHLQSLLISVFSTGNGETFNQNLIAMRGGLWKTITGYNHFNADIERLVDHYRWQPITICIRGII